MDRLVVIVLVPILVEVEKCVLQDLVDCRLPSTGWTNTHEPVPYQLSLVQLNHFTNLSACMDVR